MVDESTARPSGGVMEMPAPPARSKSDDTIIYTKDTPTHLTEKDAIERCVEGLKYAASQARELNARQPNLGWNNVRESLTAMVKSVRTLAKQKARTRQDTIKTLDYMSRRLESGDAA